MAPLARSTVLLAVFAVAWGATLTDASAAEVEWMTRRQLRDEWLRPVTVVWDGVKLRDALRRFAREERCAVLLDRRVDPDRVVRLTLAGVPLGEALERLAASQGLGVGRIGPVVYFGPPAAARSLATSAAASAEAFSSQKPTPTARRIWSAEQSLRWDDLAEPKPLLTRLARDNGATIAGLDRIPHDVWAGLELPPLTLFERFSLLLVQFDLAPSVSADGKTLTLVDLPSDPVVTKGYPTKGDAREQLARWKKLAPEAVVEATGRTIRVRGRVEDHERLEDEHRPRATPAASPADPGENRYTLTVKNKKLGEVVPALAAGFGLELTFDRDAATRAGVSLDTLVSFEGKEQTADEIFRGVLRDTGLDYRRQGKLVTIAPAAGE